MIKSKEDALELCKKYDVKLQNYKTVIVTGNGNIYVNTIEVDNSDNSELFYIKGGVEKPVEVVKEKEVLKPKKKIDNGNESNNNI